MRATSGHTVSNGRVSGAEATTPEATMAEIDSMHDAGERSASRRGGAPWPPPGADTVWWTQDGGTHTAAHPTSTAPPERSAPNIPAPTTASEAADSTTVAEAASDASPAPIDSAETGVTPDRDVTETRTGRVTRRRGPRPTSRSNDRPANSRRKKSVDSVDQPAADAEARKSVGESVEKSAVDSADVQAVGEPAAVAPAIEEPAVQEPAATEPAAQAPVEERLTDESAAEAAGDEAAAVVPPVDGDEAAQVGPIDMDAIDGDEPAGIEPADEQDASDTADPTAVTETAESADQPAFVGTGDVAINDEATADDEPAGQDAAFPMSATIVADGDFVDEPELAVPDMGAPASTRRDAPDTGFPIRTAPSARREPAPLVTAFAPARRRERMPVPLQANARSDVDLWDGDSWRVPGAVGPVRRRQPIRTGRPHRHRKAPRRPAFGLPALLVFALAAAFFAWVSATPLLLTVGHGSRGVATVATCSVHGIDRSCAEFVAADNSFSAAVTLLGPASTHATAGQKLDAQMVSRGSSLAYAGNNTDLLLHLIPGVVLLVLCGFGIAWATGALRLAGRRTRSLALLGSFGGPILLFAGMLAYAW
jgi:hypothetical protein